MATIVRPPGRAQRQAAARQQARDHSERLGTLLVQAEGAMRAALHAWRRGAPGFTLERHVADVMTRLRAPTGARR